MSPSNLPFSTPFLGFVSLVSVLLYASTRTLFLLFLHPYSLSLSIRLHGVKWVEDNKEKCHKFGESGYKLIVHAALTLWARSYLSTTPFLHSSPSLWSNHSTFVTTAFGAYYYVAQIGYNGMELGRLVRNSFIYKGQGRFGLNDNRRGDFREMIIHHLVTNLLLYLSLYFSVFRIGAVVLYIHDASDVMIDVAKMFNFMKLKVPTAVSFAGILVGWIYFRLYFYPFYVIRSSIMDTYTLGTSLYPLPIYYAIKTTFVTLLLLLLLLHVYWFYLFVEMARLLLLKFETHDLSENKNGEEYEIRERLQGGGGEEEEEEEEEEEGGEEKKDQNVSNRRRADSKSLSTHDLSQAGSSKED